MISTRKPHNTSKILIIGANGLISRLISQHLSKKNYILYGLDKLPEGEPTQRFKMEQNENSPILQKPFPGKYFIADITNETELHDTIFKMGKIDVVIVLAAALENQSIDTIKSVNEQGTENILKSCLKNGIDKVILTSSMMVIWDKYTTQEPYCSIKKNNYHGHSKDIIKITEEEILLESAIGENERIATYKNSKIKMENIAKQYALKGIDSISMRVGSVNTLNKPPKDHTWAWTSHDDVCQFIELAIQYLVTKPKDKSSSIPMFLCSDNKLRIVSLKKAREILRYIPQNGTNNSLVNLWPVLYQQRPMTADNVQIRKSAIMRKIKSNL